MRQVNEGLGVGWHANFVSWGKILGSSTALRFAAVLPARQGMDRIVRPGSFSSAPFAKVGG